MTLLTFYVVMKTDLLPDILKGGLLSALSFVSGRQLIQCFVTVLHYNRTVWAATVFVARNSCTNVIRWHSDKTKHHKGAVAAGVWCWWCRTDGGDAAKSSTRRLFSAWSWKSSQRILGIGVFSWFQSTQTFLLRHTVGLPICWLSRLLFNSSRAVAKTLIRIKKKSE